MKTVKELIDKHEEFKKKLKHIQLLTRDLSEIEDYTGWYEVCRCDFKLFVYRFCLHLFWGEPGFLHDDIFDMGNEIARSTDDMGSRPIGRFENIIAPRGNVKSTLLSICFPVWQLLYGREKLILLITNDASKAKENLKNISGLIQKSNIQSVFKPLILKNNTEEVITSHCKIMSKSINQNIRGVNEEGTRVTLCIGDDIESEEMGNSPTFREKNYKTWTDAIEPAATPPTFPIQTCFLLVNTALHPDCLVMRLQKNNRYNTKIYPAIIKEPDNNALWNKFDDILLDTAGESESQNRLTKAKQFYFDNKAEMDEGIIVNWSAGEPYWSLRAFRLQKGLASFNREKQGNPINPAKLRFSSYLLDGEKLKKDILFKVQGNLIEWCNNKYDLHGLHKWAFFDGAEGKDYEKGCYASLTCMAHLTTESERKAKKTILNVVTGLDFVLDNLLMRDPPEEQVEKIILKCQQWNIRYLVIESSTFQNMYSNILQFKAKELIERGLVNPQYNLTIIPMTPVGAKVEGGKLTYIDNILISLGLAPNTLKFNEAINQDFFKQLIEFPTGKFVDAPDSLVSALYFYYLFDSNTQKKAFENLIK